MDYLYISFGLVPWNCYMKSSSSSLTDFFGASSSSSSSSDDDKHKRKEHKKHKDKKSKGGARYAQPSRALFMIDISVVLASPPLTPSTATPSTVQQESQCQDPGTPIVRLPMVHHRTVVPTRSSWACQEVEGSQHQRVRRPASPVHTVQGSPRLNTRGRCSAVQVFQPRHTTRPTSRRRHTIRRLFLHRRTTRPGCPPYTAAPASPWAQLALG